MVSIGTIITIGIAGAIAAVGYGAYVNREKIGRAVQRGVTGSVTNPIGNYFDNLFKGSASGTGNQNMDTSITDNIQSQLDQIKIDVQTNTNNNYNNLAIPDSSITPYDQNAENQYNNDQEHIERMNMPPTPPEPEPTAPPYTPPTIPPPPTPTPLAPVTPEVAAATGHTYYYLDYAGSVRDRIVSLLPGTAEIFQARGANAINLGPSNPGAGARKYLREYYS